MRALLGLALLAGGCAHPLDGKIWSSREARFIDEPALVRALGEARYRALGERHDNAEHHAIRARLIEALARDGRRPAVVFEQLDLGVDGELARAQAAGADAEAIADAGKLDRRGWRWPLHKPLLESAVRAGLPVKSGNLSRESARAIARGAAPPALAAAPWSAAQDAGLRRDLSEGHCAPPPPKLLEGMVLAQRSRDAAMARALQDAGPGAILIAGNGHVRSDRGVPALLPETVSLGLIELKENQNDAAAYLPAPYDYLWFTGPVSRPDPCAPG
jgi:uncharacterized iron-regulated protein